MRLVNYNTGSGPRSALQTGIGTDLIDIEQAALLAGADASSAAELRDTAVVLRKGRALTPIAENAVTRIEQLRERGAVHAPDSVRLLAPVLNPQKFICLGLNYHDHAAEVGAPIPKEPIFFAKFANSLIGHGGTVVPPKIVTQLDYEAELAVVIGKPGRDIPVEQALDHVAGIMPLNDVTARDLQFSTPLWITGKAIDTFAPAGPSLVLLEEFDDIQQLGISCRVNGETVQDSNTSSMIFSVAETVNFLSRTITLETGDIIATGTPAGVGIGHKPPRFLQTGDVMDVEIEGVGVLTNPIGEPGLPLPA